MIMVKMLHDYYYRATKYNFSQRKIEQQRGENVGLCDKAKSLYTEIPTNKLPCFVEKL